MRRSIVHGLSALAGLGAAAMAPGFARAETWEALSTTAMGITGDIEVEEDAIRFDGGKTVLDLGAATEVDDFSSDGVPTAATLYRLAIPSDPTLDSGNTLCGAPITYLAILDAGPDIQGGKILDVFSQAAVPTGDDGICASYTYTVK